MHTRVHPSLICTHASVPAQGCSSPHIHVQAVAPRESADRHSSHLCTWHSVKADVHNREHLGSTDEHAALPGRAKNINSGWATTQNLSPEPDSQSAQPSPHPSRLLRTPQPSSQPQSLHVAPVPCPTCKALGTRTKTDSRDSRPTRPYSSNESGTAGPGTVSALCRWLARRCRHKARMDTPTGRWPGRRQSRPSARILRAR